MAAWFPGMMIPVATFTAAPGVTVHQATMLWPPPGLRDRESSSPAEPGAAFAVLLWDTLVAGAGAELPPPALGSSEQDWLSRNAQCPPSPPRGLCGSHSPLRQPPGQVPAVEDKGWATGEPGLAPGWQEPLCHSPMAVTP